MLTAHMIVKNEDRFIWYAVSSVLPYVDKLIIYDTGSSDNTVKIIRSFKDKKVEFEQFYIKDASEIAKLRDRQIKLTDGDWIWIVDGDEIYSSKLCIEIRSIIKSKGIGLEGIIVGRFDLLGDIYHYQDESVGTYNLFGKKGHFVLRLLNKKNIPQLHVAGQYPFEEYFDNQNIDIIYHKSEKFRFTNGKLFHAMYLQRSTLGANLEKTFHRKKHKIEIGHKFSQDTQYPEVFKSPRPSFVLEAAMRRTLLYEVAASMITPIKMFKRKLDLYR